MASPGGEATMIARTRWLRFVWLIPGLLIGCVDPEPEWKQVNDYSLERTGVDIHWQENKEDEQLINQRVKKLLANGLSEDEAVEVGLLNNKFLQAQFEELGIAKAELLQASLLSNPMLNADIRFPSGGGFTMVEGNLVWNLADLWIIPFDRELNAAQVMGTLVAVADQVIHTAAQIKRAYVDLQFAVEMRTYVAKHLQLREELLEQVQYRYEFGLHNELDVQMTAADAFLQEIELARLDAEVTQARARLNEVLSLKPKQFDYKFKPEDYAIRIASPEPLDVIPYAYKHRFDVLDRKWQVAAMEGLVDLEKARVFDIVQAGVSYAQSGGQMVSVHRKGTKYEAVKTKRVHNRATGLGLGIEIPIFDQNQAQVAKAQYQLRQAHKLLMVAKNRVRQNIYDDIARIDFHAQHARIYSQRIEPAMIIAMDYTGKYFDAMRMNILFYLQTIDRMINSHLNYLQALRNLRHALIDLELHVGGRIPSKWYTDEVIHFETEGARSLEPDYKLKKQKEPDPEDIRFEDISGERRVFPEEIEIKPDWSEDK
jgi:cobalt-zinc-cadmium efflux system outer membrane protein